MSTLGGQPFLIRQHFARVSGFQSARDLRWRSTRQVFSVQKIPKETWASRTWSILVKLVCSIRVILIRKSFFNHIVHVPKLFSLLHWSQNIFCFLCSSTPSHVGKFFRLQWEFQWENDQNKKNGQKSLFRGPKWFPKCLNGGFRGGICIEKWS